MHCFFSTYLICIRNCQFASSGCIYSKSDVIASLNLEDPIRRKLRDFNTKFLADNIVLVTYIVASY